MATPSTNRERKFEILRVLAVQVAITHDSPHVRTTMRVFTARKRKLLLVSNLACLLLRSTRYNHQWQTLWAISNTCMSVCGRLY